MLLPEALCSKGLFYYCHIVTVIDNVKFPLFSSAAAIVASGIRLENQVYLISVSTSSETQIVMKGCDSIQIEDQFDPVPCKVNSF